MTYTIKNIIKTTVTIADKQYDDVDKSSLAINIFILQNEQGWVTHKHGDFKVTHISA